MHDDEGSSASSPVLVATTLLTAAVGVGAVLYNRSGVNINLTVGEMLGALGLVASGSGSIKEREAEVAVDDKAKAPRSKERRRRGKDPLKDVLKGSKKAKARLEKVLATTSIKDPGGTEHDDAPRDSEQPTTSSEYATSSRSVSSASSSRIMMSCSEDDDLTPLAVDDELNTPSLASSVSTVSGSSVSTMHSDSENEPFRPVEPAPHDALAKQKAPPKRRNTAHNYSPSPCPSRPSSVHPSSTHSSRAPTPPPATQLASMRGALEAARTREEAARRDLERYGKDLEMMRWERDTLRAQICQMQSYFGALLATPPPFSPYGPPNVGNWYPPLHMQVPYSHSSPGGSPASRGRRRTRPDITGDNDDDSEVSEALADAILKRPDAMLGPRSTPQSPSAHSSSSMRSTRSSPAIPSRDLVVEELTFPSLYPQAPS